MRKILDVKATDRCDNCRIEFADHNYDEERDLYICPHPHQEVGYGGFKGGNPNDFSPDSQCCSPKEIQSWRDACKKWNDGDETPLDFHRCKDENGISGEGWKFGIGVYVLELEQTWEPM